jgi:hypothetical protein
LLSETLADHTALGLAADLGLLYQTGLEGLSLGAAAKNMGTPSSMGGQAFYAPFEFSAGSAYRFFHGQGKALLEADFGPDEATALAAGLEWDFDNLLQPRVGYRYNQGSNPWAAGLGFKLGTWGIDLAVVPAGDLGLTYRGSLYYRFGGPQAKLLGADSVITSAPGGEGVLNPVVTAPDKVASWALYIYTPASSRFRRVVGRSLTGKGALPARLVWDGRYENGQAAPDGVYQAILSLRYQDDEIIYSPALEIIVANAVVKAYLELDSASQVHGNPGALFMPARFRVHTQDLRPMKAWKVEVLDNTYKVFRTLSGDWTEGGGVDWDGKGDQGEAFISGQVYGFRLKVTDVAGRELAMPQEMKYKAVFRQ